MKENADLLEITCLHYMKRFQGSLIDNFSEIRHFALSLSIEFPFLQKLDEYRTSVSMNTTQDKYQKSGNRHELAFTPHSLKFSIFRIHVPPDLHTFRQLPTISHSDHNKSAKNVKLSMQIASLSKKLTPAIRDKWSVSFRRNASH